MEGFPGSHMRATPVAGRNCRRLEKNALDYSQVLIDGSWTGWSKTGGAKQKRRGRYRRAVGRISCGSLGRRPQIDADLRTLIRRMSIENALWGAPHIHGELLKLGFAVAQSTVAKYMTKRRDPSAQGWGTFLRLCAGIVPAFAAIGAGNRGCS